MKVLLVLFVVGCCWSETFLPRGWNLHRRREVASKRRAQNFSKHLIRQQDVRDQLTRGTRVAKSIDLQQEETRVTNSIVEEDWKKYLLPPYMPNKLRRENSRSLYTEVLRPIPQTDIHDDSPWSPIFKPSDPISPILPRAELDARVKKETKPEQFFEIQQPKKKITNFFPKKESSSKFFPSVQSTKVNYKSLPNKEPKSSEFIPVKQSNKNVGNIASITESKNVRVLKESRVPTKTKTTVSASIKEQTSANIKESTSASPTRSVNVKVNKDEIKDLDHFTSPNPTKHSTKASVKNPIYFKSGHKRPKHFLNKNHKIKNIKPRAQNVKWRPPRPTNPRPRNPKPDNPRPSNPRPRSSRPNNPSTSNSRPNNPSPNNSRPGRPSKSKSKPTDPRPRSLAFRPKHISQRFNKITPVRPKNPPPGLSKPEPAGPREQRRRGQALEQRQGLRLDEFNPVTKALWGSTLLLGSLIVI